MKLDPIQVEQLKHARDLLDALNEFFEEGTAVQPGALLLDDDSPAAEHVDVARENLREILASL